MLSGLTLMSVSPLARKVLGHTPRTYPVGSHVIIAEVSKAKGEGRMEGRVPRSVSGASPDGHAGLQVNRRVPIKIKYSAWPYTYLKGPRTRRLPTLHVLASRPGPAPSTMHCSRVSAGAVRATTRSSQSLKMT